MSVEDEKYSEKIWNRDDGQIDGYVFKGKRAFGPALEGLKNIMQKGKSKEIENVTFKVLDSKPRGSGLEIIVQVSANKSKGQAILKVYGPKDDIKKENSVTVTKSKDSETKYVVILAEKVVKPLMNGFLSGDMEVAENVQNTIKPAPRKNFKCNFCEKMCKTPGGLKGHITKKHLNFKQSENQDQIETKEDEEDGKNKRKKEEVNELVESLISSVIQINEEDEKVTLEESVIEEKKYYTKMCNVCDFEVESTKNYISVQKILKHRDSCSLRVQCFQCDLRFKDQNKMKKHMRDVHGLSTNSMSPPIKKKKVDILDELTTNKDIIDLSESIEEMEIDSNEKEEDVLKERSRLMDEKVNEKQMKDDEEMKNFLQKRKNLSEEISSKERKQVRTEKSIKQKKQKNKVVSNRNVFHKFKNLKEVPDNCKHLVDKGDLVYVVPGDGACGPRSAAAHLFQDEVFGPRLRKKMNNFFAKLFYKKYQFLTPCSPESPFKRKVKNKNVQFTDPEKLIQFLRTSDDAMYMWTDSEDLAIIADMYQMRIMIITTKGEHDDNPVVSWIYPDETLADEAELKNVAIKDMRLFHENDIHFNLIVAEGSLLATMGSLSYRNNISSMVEVEEKQNETEDIEGEDNVLKEQQEEPIKENDKAKVEEAVLSDKLTKIKCDECDSIVATRLQLDKHKELKHKRSVIKEKCLKECQEKLEYVEKEYFKCEKELRRITEENEKNKIEINDLRAIIDLRQKADKMEDEEETKSESVLFAMKNKGFQRNGPHTESVLRKSSERVENSLTKYKCRKCDFIGLGESHFKNHMKLIHKEEEFNCMQCDYQGHTMFQLQKHIKIKHENKGEEEEIAGQIRCRICAEVFEEKANLMIHRKIKHASLVAQCKNYEEGKCTFTSKSCYWIHEPKVSRSDNCHCYVCGKSFKTKSEMMGHRKQYHANVVRLCSKFTEGKCPFQDEFCWFIHSQTRVNKTVTKEDINETSEDAMEMEEMSGFQMETKKNKPPLNQTKRKLQN